MKKLVPLLILITAVMVIDSCRRDNYQPICYGNDIQPILTRSCTNIGCHSAGSKAGGYTFTAYDGVMEAVIAGDANGSPLYDAIKGSHPEMPKEGEKLTRKEVNKIKSWIDFGAKDCASTNTVISNCDTVDVKYTSHIKPLMDAFCNSCHFTGNTNTGHVLDTYDGVKISVLSGKLVPAVKHLGISKMPKGGQKLSDCNISKIDKWIAAGMPN